MSVTALILAAALSATPTSAWPVDASPVPASVGTPTAETPNLYRQAARCGPVHEQVVQRQRAALRGKARGLQYAVLRQVDGCAVSSPVGYHPDYLAPGRADTARHRPNPDSQRR